MIVALLAALIVLGAPCVPTVRAHPLAPALLELREDSSGAVDVLWKTSRLRPRGTQLEPVLPERCEDLPESEATTTVEQTAVLQRKRVLCPGGLHGAVVRVAGLEQTGLAVLVRVAFRDGRVVRHVLHEDSSSFTIPAAESRMQVARTHGSLGIRHLLGGLDHLAFLLGLLLWVRGFRRVAMTITAFTAGHSVTLALASLGWLRLPSALAELGIAASLVWLALALARGSGPDVPGSAGAAPMRVMGRTGPWGIAFLFGLLHGLGFAGALADLGLPRHELPLALFSFNVGIEVAQLLVVAMLLLVGHALVRGRVPQRFLHAGERVVIYAIGSVGVFWCLDRAVALLPGLL